MFQRLRIICYVLAAISALLVSSKATLADTTTIRLICAYEHTLDLKDATSSPTGGEDLVTVRYEDDGSAIIKVEDVGAYFTGTVSDEEIAGVVTYVLSSGSWERAVTQKLEINRYTGAFTLTFEIGDGGLMHHGKCRKVDKPQF